MSEDNYPDLNKICRLCLQDEGQEDFVDIFPQNAQSDCSDGQLSIPMRIMACASLEVHSCDGLPKMICSDCRYQLEKSYYFRKHSQLADNKLRKHIRCLTLGKKSRVFEKCDDDEFSDELEFEDSLQFIRQIDECRERKREAECKEKLQEELQSELAIAKSEWAKECKESMRDEVAAELRSSVVEEVKKEVKAELECELQETLRDECREEERQALLTELEDYLKMKRGDGANVNTKCASSENTAKANEITSQHRSSSAVPPTPIKRPLCRCSPPPVAKRPLIRSSAISSRVMSNDALHNRDAGGASTAPPIPFEAITLIKGQDNIDDAEAEHDFYIVEADNNDETEESADQRSESQDSSVKERSGSENFRLEASEKLDPRRGNGSYHIEPSGEIQFYKKTEEELLDEDRCIDEDTNDDEEDCEGNVIVFNFEEGLESDQMETMEIMSLAKKIIVMKPSEHLQNTSEETKESKPSFTKSIENNGNMVTASSSFSEVVPARTTDTPKTFKCNLCPMAFSTENSLNRHLRTHRKMEQRGVSYQCPECFIYLSCKSALNRHLVIHTGERPHVCEECGKSFVQREILKRHMQTHSGVKQHKCPHCVRTFAQKNSLTHHVNRLHTDVPVAQFPCHLCPKRFNHASGLSRHLGTHTGLTFQCTKCKRKFADRSSIKRHIANVHGEGKDALKLHGEGSDGAGKNDDADYPM